MKHGQYIISGYVNGQKFRPSNWSERLCEAGATFDPLKRVMRYSEHFYPRQCEQYGCSVYVDFDALDNDMVRYIHWFVESNALEAVALYHTGPVEVITNNATIEMPQAAAVSLPSTQRKSFKSAKTAA